MASHDGKNPPRFIYSGDNKRYHTYDFEMRRRYGAKCVKISLDAGFSCPNSGKCIYCRDGSSSADATHDIARQFTDASALLRRKWGADVRYIPYLQAHTNTYAPPDTLRRVYNEVIGLCGGYNIAAMSIATRPDALGEGVLEVLRETAQKIPLTVELGLQSSNDATLERIGRGHDFACFERAVETLKAADIEVCAHIINGLPGEGEDDMLETARALARLGVGGVKLHMLNIIAETPLAEMYARGEVKLMTLTEYVRIVIGQLELLPPEVYIGRVCGDSTLGGLIAPLWCRRKLEVLNEIDKQMTFAGTYQGRLCK
ncbi:MAG: TIGR01212 family radical SAM protein [Eubacteriales bacterium]